MSRQFRKDDTSKWKEGFGKGVDGALTISANTTEAPIDSSCSGVAGSNSLSATNALFSPGQFILIHKSRGNTTVGIGNWELNVVSAYTPGTITTKYPLQFSYNDSGVDQSQVRVLKQHTNVTINAGVTYSAKAWNGDVGGILAFIASGTVTINGAINIAGNSASSSSPFAGGVGIGFPGGNRITADNQYGYQGAGANTGGTGGQSRSANDTGGGGGGSFSGNGNGGGGGSNRTAGSNGVSGNNNFGYGATTVYSTASGVIMTFGGGGGGAGGSADWSGSGAGAGAGILLIIAPTIIINNTTGLVNAYGGKNSVNKDCTGGGGAGGFVLFKCVNGQLGENRINAKGGVPTASYVPGGPGGDGGIHVDYKDTCTGTTNPTLDTSQDSSLKYPSGAGVLLSLFQ